MAFKNTKIPLLDRSEPEPVMNYSLYLHFIPFTHDEQGWKISQQEEYETLVEPALLKIVEYLRRKPDAKMSYADLSHIAVGSKRKPQLEYSVNKVVNSNQLEIATSGWTQTYWASSYYTDFLSNMGYGRRYLNKTFGYSPKTLLDVDQQGITLTAMRLLKKAGIDNLVFGQLGTEFLERNSQPGVANPVLNISLSATTNESISLLVHSETLDGNPNTRLPTWLGISNILDQGFDLHVRILNDLEAHVVMVNSSSTRGKAMRRESGGYVVPRLVGGRYAFYSPDVDFRHIDLYVVFVQSNNLSGRLARLVYATVSTTSDFFKNAHIPDVTHLASSPVHVTLRDEAVQEATKTVTGGFVTGSLYKRSIRSFSQLLMCLKGHMSMYLVRFPDVFGFDLDGILDRISFFHQWTAMSQHHKLFGGHTACAVTQTKLTELEKQHLEVRAIWKDFLARFVKPANKFVNADLLEYRIISPRGENIILESGTYLLVNGEKGGALQIQATSSLPRLNLRTADNLKISRVLSTCWGQPICEHVFALQNVEPYEAITLYVDPSQDNIPTDNWVELVQNIAPLSLSLFSLRRLHQNSSLGWVTPTILRYTVPSLSIDIEYELCKYVWTGQGQKPTAELLANDVVLQCLQPDQARFQIQGQSVVIHSTYESGFCSLELKHIPDSPSYASLIMRINCKAPESPRKSDRDYVIRYRSSVKNMDHRIAADSNGLETEFHTDQKVLIGGKLAGFRPITKFAYIEDSQTRFSVVVDRAKALRSKDIEPGVIELMFFRVYRPLQDGSTCSESNPISITHYLNFEKIIPNSRELMLHRKLQIRLDSPPLIVALSNFSINEILITTYGSPRILEFPHESVRVELDILRTDCVMLRLHNLHETEQVSVQLDDYLSNRFKIFYFSVEEYTVDFFQPLPNGLSFKYDDKQPPVLHLLPMSARTFRITPS